MWQAREIFKIVGVNPIILDQKLEYQLRFIFFKIKKRIEETNGQIEPLEPENGLSNQANLTL